jgi:hypothetical protein
MSRYWKQQGWSKITSVEGQVIREIDGLPAYSEDYGHNPIVLELVWITTQEGDIYSDQTRHGETLEQRVAYYQKRGWTDDRCCLFTTDNKGVV